MSGKSAAALVTDFELSFGDLSDHPAMQQLTTTAAASTSDPSQQPLIAPPAKRQAAASRRQTEAVRLKG